MSKVIYGIDPDSKRHGIAVYRNGVLCELLNMNTIELYIHITSSEKVALQSGELEIHMENPCGVSASTFSHNRKDPLPVKFKKSEGVGRVKQAQVSIEQTAEALNIPVTKYRNSSRWKKGNDAKLFNKITGWTGRSNEETRSAAHFGYLGVSNVQQR